MPPSTPQSINQSKPRSHLKTWQWITPIATLAAFVGGYFAYQNYLLQKTERENNLPAPAKNLSQGNTASEEARYRGFPFYERDRDYVRLDALDSALTANIEAHVLVTENPENEHYFDTVQFGQIIVDNYHQFNLNCPGLVRLEGTMTKLEYGSVLRLEKYACLDFLDPIEWHSFSVNSARIMGAITNPFPTRQIFRLELNGAEQTFALDPRATQEINMPINCDEEIGVFSQGLLQGRIEFEGSYNLFDRSIDINFDTTQCPTSPKFDITTNFDVPFDLERRHYAMEVNKETHIEVTLKNEGSKEAKNLTVRIELPTVITWSEAQKEPLIIFSQERAPVTKITQDIPFLKGGQTLTLAFNITPIDYTVWTTNIESHLLYNGKQERRIMDNVYTFSPGVAFYANADEAEKNFVDGYAEFNAKIVNTGIPTEFKFYLREHAKGFYPCKWYWGVPKTHIMRLEFIKRLETNEEMPFVLECNERALNVPQLQGIKEILIDLEITPKQDGMKEEVIPMKIMRS